MLGNLDISRRVLGATGAQVEGSKQASEDFSSEIGDTINEIEVQQDIVVEFKYQRSMFGQSR